MSWLRHACASSAALAALLAFLVWIVARRRPPALAHALWLLVLLKLVTPPLVPVRVLPWFSEYEPSRPIQVAVVEPIWEPEPVPPPRNPPTLVRVRSVSQASADERKRSAEEMAILMGKLIPPEMRAIMPPIPPPQPLAEPDSVVEDTPEEPEAIAAPI